MRKVLDNISRGRPRTGCVVAQGKSWRGRFFANGPDGARRRMNVTLGLTSEVSREQAHAQLRGMINRAEDLDGAERLITTADILMPADFGAVSRSLTNLKQGRGVISQLIVAADLTARGFQVFQPLNLAASCDLVVLVHEWKALRVEVKTAKRESSGTICCDIARNVGKFDILAAVTNDGAIHYRAASRISNLLYPFGRERSTKA